MAEPETTMAGVVVKAQALAAWGTVEDVWQAFGRDSYTWGPALSASVLRIAGGQATGPKRTQISFRITSSSLT